MATHDLKTWPDYYDSIAIGVKTFEVRKNDRDYHDGDTLILLRYDPKTRNYTGERMVKTVRYVMYGGQFGIAPDYCVMAIQ